MGNVYVSAEALFTPFALRQMCCYFGPQWRLFVFLLELYCSHSLSPPSERRELRQNVMWTEYRRRCHRLTARQSTSFSHMSEKSRQRGNIISPLRNQNISFGAANVNRFLFAFVSDVFQFHPSDWLITRACAYLRVIHISYHGVCNCNGFPLLLINLSHLQSCSALRSYSRFSFVGNGQSGWGNQAFFFLWL